MREIGPLFKRAAAEELYESIRRKKSSAKYVSISNSYLPRLCLEEVLHKELLVAFMRDLWESFCFLFPLSNESRSEV
jgi:hypothetical protein